MIETLAQLGGLLVILIVQGASYRLLNHHNHVTRGMVNEIRECITETIVNEIRRQDERIDKRKERQAQDKTVDNGEGLTSFQSDFKMLPGRSYRKRK